MIKKLFIGIILFSTATFGQVVDAELWTGLGLKANINKKISLKYETQTRFNQNVSQLKTYYNELSADYELAKTFSVGLSYRYSRRNRLTHYVGDNRFLINAEYSKKLGETGLRFKARARYQHSFDRLRPINNLIFPDVSQVFRLKLDLCYRNDKFKRISPSLGYEYFKTFNPSTVTGPNSFRLYTAVDFDLPARHEISLKYIYERDFGNIQTINHIWAIQYNYSLSNKLFKKKKK